MFAVDYSVVASYTSRIEDFLDYYEKFRSYAIYQDNENINGIDCRKFIASFDSFCGNHFAEFWVDPTTGICVKRIYRYQSSAVIKAFYARISKQGKRHCQVINN